MITRGLQGSESIPADQQEWIVEGLQLGVDADMMKAPEKYEVENMNRRGYL